MILKFYDDGQEQTENYSRRDSSRCNAATLCFTIFENPLKNRTVKIKTISTCNTVFYRIKRVKQEKSLRLENIIVNLKVPYYRKLMMHVINANFKNSS